jgi:cytochrome P450
VSKPAGRLDPLEIRQLFDLRSEHFAPTNGGYVDDPYPAFARLRESGPVHEGVVHKLVGWDGDAVFQGLPFADRPHYSAFSFEACERAFRDEKVFSSSFGVDLELNSLIAMEGREHHRYRGLVQPSFVPAKAQWWIQRWIAESAHSLIDGFVGDGRADLNIDFCAAIPVVTITGSFGIPVDQALRVRSVVREATLMHGPGLSKFVEILAPIVAARRAQPGDDLISVLVSAELTDADGVKHHLSDEEIYSFSYLLLSAGSGTTARQMAITLAAMLTRPDLLSAARRDPALIRPIVEESLRWAPTDPMFARLVAEDVEFFGRKLPAGALLHLCVGAANRDPARWPAPDDFDPFRRAKSNLAFGSGPHICLGLHVARAEMVTGISAVLDRLPNLRLDPGAEPPRVIGMYERGPAELPVLFG